jgi:hypothetical protein
MVDELRGTLIREDVPVVFIPTQDAQGGLAQVAAAQEITSGAEWLQIKQTYRACGINKIHNCVLCV